jgi:hypothetical protein
MEDISHYHFQNGSFPFQEHSNASPSGHYDHTGLPAYGIPLRPDQHQSWPNDTNSLPTQLNGGPNGVQDAQRSPQGRLRNKHSNQASPLNTASRNLPDRVNSPAQRGNQRSNGIAFKNSSSSFPQGGTVSSTDPAEDPDNIYIPLSAALDPNVNYFSSETPAQVSDGPVDPALEATSVDDAPSGPMVNPFSDTYPLVTHPDYLDQWRDRLFNVEQPLHLTEAQFLTYFPHIDNVYSHRSTQKYKRKPFMSHYWDCRLKGRPSGTKKSDDPNKKKRKREKRERDLCDVKIKVTEWFGEDQCREMGVEPEYPQIDGSGADGLHIVMESAREGAEGAGNTFGLLEPSKGFPVGHPGAGGKRWYTIQRVNGSLHSNAAVGIPPNSVNDDLDINSEDRDLDHKHSLEESDRIKKNSVQRYLLKEQKERKAASKVWNFIIILKQPH